MVSAAWGSFKSRCLGSFHMYVLQGLAQDPLTNLSGEVWEAGSLDCTGIAWLRAGTFGLTWYRLVSLSITWYHLVSLGLTWSHMDPLGLT